MPFVNRDDKMHRLPFKEASLTGFWQKINFKGSLAPSSKQNTLMMHETINGKRTLTFYGGYQQKAGPTKFEQHQADLKALKWRRIEYDGTRFGEI